MKLSTITTEKPSYKPPPVQYIIDGRLIKLPLILCFLPPTSRMIALLFLSAGMEIMLVSL